MSSLGFFIHLVFIIYCLTIISKHNASIPFKVRLLLYLLAFVPMLNAVIAFGLLMYNLYKEYTTTVKG